MRDYYQDGIDDGCGRHRYDDGDYPQNNGDLYDYQLGLERGQRRRRNYNEIDRETDSAWESCSY